MEQDTLSRILCEEYKLRIYTVTSLKTVRKICSVHHTGPISTIALGRSLNAGALLGATLKPESTQSLSYKISSSGTIKEIHVQADARGNIRGYISSQEFQPAHGEASDISSLLGAGVLTITKDLGMKEPYSSVSPLLKGDIAVDTASYLTSSEQIPSAIIIGLLPDPDGNIVASGGILIQTLPDTNKEILLNIEQNISNLTPSLGKRLFTGNDIYNTVSEIMNNNPLTILSTTPLKVSCKCNRLMLEQIVQGIDPDELEEIIQKDKGIEFNCAFCKTSYYFYENDIRSLIKN